MKEQYKFSIVTAVYNVEAFLAEMIDSVVNQTIGLEHIQLILVNDGSTDGSGAICDRYGEQYPDNIVVIHKENGGVSTARNEGLKYVRGELVNFLDSDDKLSENTLEDVYDFYQAHRDETDLIAIPMYFFDGQTGGHILNYKFNQGTRVVDLDTEWQNPQLSLSSAFVRWEAFQGLKFDTRLKYVEDAQLVQKILAKKQTMGLVSEARYDYRRRSIGEMSAVQSSISSKAWYNQSVRYFSLELLQWFTDNYGYVPLYAQYMIMYDLQWKIQLTTVQDSVLNKEEKIELIELLKTVFQYIDDQVIQAQRNIMREHKIHVLRLKHSGKLPLRQLDGDYGIVSDNKVIYKMSTFPIRVEFVNIEREYCIIDGSVSFFYQPFDKYEIGAMCQQKEYPAEVYKRRKEGKSLDYEIYHQDMFKIRVPLSRENENPITLYLKHGEEKIHLTDIREGVFLPVCKTYENSYYVHHDWVLQMKNDTICLRPYDKQAVSRMERNFRKELWKSNGVGERKAVLSRIAASICRKCLRKPIWLVSDRAAKAGDNGEAFFRYLCEHHKNITPYFVIYRNSDDFKRMSRVGKVVAKDSFKHKFLLLLSDYIISSHAEIEIFNPFNGYSDPYRDLLAKTKFIFLQHGVTKDDVSSWLNKYSRNLYGFVTAANPEFKSIVDPNSRYFYTDRQVWLTGFPRYDRLYRDDQKQVVIMPTWRKYLMSHFDRETGDWVLKAGFEQSAFFKFYNELLNHERLLDAAKRYGYQICFFPHPTLQRFMGMFQKAEQVKFLDPYTQYRDIYATSSLILTDYSSAVYDFAYLRKPIMYTHFDAEEFFAGGHAYEKGYFDYERDGFGEVEYDLEGTVDRIIEYMANGCQMKDKYKERVDQFFAYNDQNNCQRLYDRIMELEREHGR